MLKYKKKVNSSKKKTLDQLVFRKETLKLFSIIK